jgi:hypothetical protein
MDIAHCVTRASAYTSGVRVMDPRWTEERLVDWVESGQGVAWTLPIERDGRPRVMVMHGRWKYRLNVEHSPWLHGLMCRLMNREELAQRLNRPLDDMSGLFFATVILSCTYAFDGVESENEWPEMRFESMNAALILTGKAWFPQEQDDDVISYETTERIKFLPTADGRGTERSERRGDLPDEVFEEYFSNLMDQSAEVLQRMRTKIRLFGAVARQSRASSRTVRRDIIDAPAVEEMLQRYGDVEDSPEPYRHIVVRARAPLIRPKRSYDDYLHPPEFEMEVIQRMDISNGSNTFQLERVVIMTFAAIEEFVDIRVLERASEEDVEAARRLLQAPPIHVEKGDWMIHYDDDDDDDCPWRHHEERDDAPWDVLYLHGRPLATRGPRYMQLLLDAASDCVPE